MTCIHAPRPEVDISLLQIAVALRKRSLATYLRQRPPPSEPVPLLDAEQSKPQGIDQWTISDRIPVDDLVSR